MQNYLVEQLALIDENSRLSSIRRPLGKNMPRDPHERRFANLTRTKSGSCEDEDLASIFVAGAFGANQVPEILRDVEILGIMQSPLWKFASLNEFRKFFNSPRMSHSRVSIQIHMLLNSLCDFTAILISLSRILVWLWKMPNIQRRRAAASVLGYTISRAVFSDSVALVRGDRFYAVDDTPKNLTYWGLTEADLDLTVDNGHVFYKLVLRALPRHFHQDSIYAHYPVVAPEENRIILGGLNTAQSYNLEKPCAASEMGIIESYVACKAILRNQRDYRVI
jgi:hypothetical protein